MSLTDDAKKLEEQMKVYKDAFNKVKAELTQARTDLAAQAKVTVDILDARIPTLRQDVLIKENQLSNLDKAIEEKNARLNAEETDLKAHYKKLEQGLINDYELRSKTIDAQRAELNKATLELNHRAEVLNDEMSLRESTLKKMSDTFVSREFSLKKAIEDFNEQKDIFFKEVHDTQSRMEGMEKKTTELLKEANDKNAEAGGRLASVEERESKAEKVIAKEASINDRETGLNARQRDIEEKEAVVNAKSTHVRAEAIRIDIKDSEQRKRDEELKRREESVKLLEAKHG